MNRKALDQSADLLLGRAHPLLVVHISPDGDAIGSLLGLGWVLRKLGKEPVTACADPLPRRFAFLPGFSGVTDRPAGPFDLLVVLDCSDLERVGRIAEDVPVSDLPLLNIDHHVTNDGFGTVNLVDGEAVSTTMILYWLIRHLGLSLDPSLAVCLLTGLVTDTRGFRTSNVTADTLRVAVELMEAGASLPTVTRCGLDQRPLSVLRLWGKALERMEMTDGIVSTSLPLAVQHTVGYDGCGDVGLSDLLSSVQEALVSVVFTERRDAQIEVGFRAAPGLDVAEVARALGGGGHTLASGCLVPGPLEQARERVLRILREHLRRQRASTEAGSAVTGCDGRRPQY